MEKRHSVENVHIEQGLLCLVVDGCSYQYKLESISNALAAASKAERKTFDISPGGYGIHWPLIDEDLSIDGLLRMNTQEPSTASKSRAH